MAGTRQTGGISKIKTTMTDAAIKARTGKDWAGWFAALDKAGAAKLDHKARTKDKYWRGKWKSGRLEVGFYAKGAGKAQIALQSNKLPNAEAVEKERILWKKAIDKLQEIVKA